MGRRRRWWPGRTLRHAFPHCHHHVCHQHPRNVMVASAVSHHFCKQGVHGFMRLQRPGEGHCSARLLCVQAPRLPCLNLVLQHTPVLLHASGQLRHRPADVSQLCHCHSLHSTAAGGHIQLVHGTAHRAPDATPPLTLNIRHAAPHQVGPGLVTHKGQIVQGTLRQQDQLPAMQTTTASMRWLKPAGCVRCTGGPPVPLACVIATPTSVHKGKSVAMWPCVCGAHW